MDLGHYVDLAISLRIVLSSPKQKLKEHGV